RAVLQVRDVGHVAAVVGAEEDVDVVVLHSSAPVRNTFYSTLCRWATVANVGGKSGEVCGGPQPHLRGLSAERCRPAVDGGCASEARELRPFTGVPGVPASAIHWLKPPHREAR